jgi:PAS domain-containing protein
MRLATEKTAMRRTHARAHRVSATGSDAPPSRSGDPAISRSAAPSEGGERFRMLFDYASVGMIAVGADGRAVEANPAVERMTPAS